MVTKLVNQPLGMGVAGMKPRKMIAPAIIGAGISLGSSIFGGIKASKAAREAAQRQKEMEAKENAWYLRRYNQDYIDTAAGQNLVRRARDFAKENWRKAAGAQAVAGGTDAATAQAKEAGNKMMGETLGNIAGTDAIRKENIDNRHLNNQLSFTQMDMNREQNRANAITNAAQNASNAAMAMGGALEQDSANKTNLNGGNNNGTAYTPPTSTASEDATNLATGGSNSIGGINDEVVDELMRANG